jgi:hypothetical protein
LPKSPDPVFWVTTALLASSRALGFFFKSTI